MWCLPKQFFFLRSFLSFSFHFSFQFLSCLSLFLKILTHSETPSFSLFFFFTCVVYFNIKSQITKLIKKKKNIYIFIFNVNANAVRNARKSFFFSSFNVFHLGIPIFLCAVFKARFCIYLRKKNNNQSIVTNRYLPCWKFCAEFD